MDPAIEADLALLRAELALHAVMTPQCGALLTDTKGIIVYVNARLSDITGYSREKLIGQHSRILRPPNMTPDKYRSILNTASVGHCWRGDMESRRENGERYPTRMIITPLKDALGQTTHFSVILQNMTTGSTS